MCFLVFGFLVWVVFILFNEILYSLCCWTQNSKPMTCKRQNIITCSLNFGCQSVKTSWQFCCSFTNVVLECVMWFLMIWRMCKIHILHHIATSPKSWPLEPRHHVPPRRHVVEESHREGAGRKWGRLLLEMTGDLFGEVGMVPAWKPSRKSKTSAHPKKRKPDWLLIYGYFCWIIYG